MREARRRAQSSGSEGGWLARRERSSRHSADKVDRGFHESECLVWPPGIERSDHRVKEQHDWVIGRRRKVDGVYRYHVRQILHPWRRICCPYLTVPPGISPSIIAVEKEKRTPGTGLPGTTGLRSDRRMRRRRDRVLSRFAYCRRADPARLPAGRRTDQEQVPGAGRETDPTSGRRTVRERREPHGPGAMTKRST